jgi:3-phytase
MSSVPAPRVLPASARRRLTTTAIVIALAAGLVGVLQPARAEQQPAGDAKATVETAPVSSSGNTTATDVAIWVNPLDASKSVIIGTDTKAGLEGYNLAGSRLWKVPENPAPRSIDLRKGFALGSQQLEVVGTLGNGVMRFYSIDPATRKLDEQSVQGGLKVSTNGVQDQEANALCMYKSPVSGAMYAFVASNQGNIKQYELFDNAGKIDARSVRPGNGGIWDAGLLGTPVENCVVDDTTSTLYIAERDTAIWRYGAEPTASTSAAGSVDMMAPLGRIASSVKGLAVVHTSDATGYLIASSPGNDSFLVYRKEAGNAFVRQFKVIDDTDIDGCNKTKGIEAVAANLGAAFPNGVFVCQDDNNTPGNASNQNYKLVPLMAVADATPIAVPVTTTTTAAPTSSTTVTTAPGTGPAGGSAANGRSGYWMVGSDGKVYPFGEAKSFGDVAGRLPATAEAVDLEPTPSFGGYWIVNDKGTVYSFGDAKHLGNADRSKMASDEWVTSLSATPTGLGYWIFTSRGRTLAFGDAKHLGDMSATRLNGPVLDSIPTPTGNGYYMVASDGGIFTFGDAKFWGSMGDKKLNAPVQSLVPDGDRVGYWLVASDGGIFSFQAPFRGSMGNVKLNKPVTGMVRFGNGYLMVASDGGIFNFSDKPFHGSLGDRPPARPIVSVAALT